MQGTPSENTKTTSKESRCKEGHGKRQENQDGPGPMHLRRAPVVKTLKATTPPPGGSVAPRCIAGRDGSGLGRSYRCSLQI